MNKNFASREGIFDEFYWATYQSNGFILSTRQTGQKLLFCFSMETFWIDSSDETRKDKQMRFFRQADALSREPIPFIFLSRQPAAISRDYVPLD